MPGQFCKNCVHWEKNIFSRIGEKMGVCHESQVESKIMKAQQEDEDLPCTLFTSEWFGCIYFREGQYVLVDINKTLKEEGWDFDDEDETK